MLLRIIHIPVELKGQSVFVFHFLIVSYYKGVARGGTGGSDEPPPS